MLKVLKWFCLVQFNCSVMSDSVTPRTVACQVSLSITNSQILLKLMSIESVTPSNHLILCRSLLLLPSICPSIRVFSNESVLYISCQRIGVSASASALPNGLISFRMYWFDLLAVQGTLNSLQHPSSNTSILRRSVFFIVQLLKWLRCHIHSGFFTSVKQLWNCASDSVF